MKNEQKDWDLLIKPQKSIFELNLSSIWEYRDLLWLLVDRDFKAQYKQTILGPLWHIIQPLLTTFVFLIVFNNIAKIPTDSINPVLFYLSGLTLWGYFSSCLNGTANTFVGNAAIFGKVYFPRLIMPLSTIISNLIKLCIQFILLIVAIIVVDINAISLTVNLVFIPVLIFIAAILGMGLGVIISSLTSKYKDFTVLVGFGIQLLLYATPVFYSTSFFKNSPYYKFILLNPLTSLIEAFRFCIFGTGDISVIGLVYSFLMGFIILIIGILIFNKTEKSFMDTV